jgi:hypothetical protein
MSVTMFLALCILGCDFMLYALFQFLYSEKRSQRAARKAAALRNQHDSSTSSPSQNLTASSSRELPPPVVAKSRVLPFRRAVRSRDTAEYYAHLRIASTFYRFRA